jgi:hypothetical protein
MRKNHVRLRLIGEPRLPPDLNTTDAIEAAGTGGLKPLGYGHRESLLGFWRFVVG